MKFILLVLITQCLSISIFGQKSTTAPRVLTLEHNQTNTVNEKQHRKALQADLQGTFQFQIDKENYSALITTELLEKIKTERLQSEDVYFEIDEFINVFIPSYQKINATSFIPLATSLYIH